jgi:biopolymer transport protein ExbD
MKLRRRSRSAFSESSAASDLAFLLIIYFIVIAGFNVNKGFLMNLPNKDSTRLILKDDLLRYNLNAAGEIIFRGEIQTRAAAERDIKQAVSYNPNLALLLTIDPKTPWQDVVSFVELAQDLKIDSFSFTIDKTALASGEAP